ncbi:MAG: hypothetical protein ACLUIQ_02985 [Dialister invisus]
MSELKHAQKELEDAKEAQDMTVTISIFAASMIIPAFLTEFKKNIPISVSKSSSSGTVRK